MTAFKGPTQGESGFKYKLDATSIHYLAAMIGHFDETQPKLAMAPFSQYLLSSGS
jgi:hypothetical protein